MKSNLHILNSLTPTIVQFTIAKAKIQPFWKKELFTSDFVSAITAICKNTLMIINTTYQNITDFVYVNQPLPRFLKWREVCHFGLLSPALRVNYHEHSVCPRLLVWNIFFPLCPILLKDVEWPWTKFLRQRFKS